MAVDPWQLWCRDEPGNAANFWQIARASHYGRYAVRCVQTLIQPTVIVILLRSVQAAAKANAREAWVESLLLCRRTRSSWVITARILAALNKACLEPIWTQNSPSRWIMSELTAPVSPILVAAVVKCSAGFARSPEIRSGDCILCYLAVPLNFQVFVVYCLSWQFEDLELEGCENCWLG